MACLVMIPNQVSIWFSRLDPIGVKWNGPNMPLDLHGPGLRHPHGQLA
jgi:hypothetical protein